MKRFRIIFLGIAVACSATFGEQKSLSFAYLNFPPWSFSSEDGQFSGSMSDEVMKTVAYAGYKLDASTYPAKRYYSMMAAGEFTLGAIAALPELIDKVRYFDEYWHTLKMNVYFLGTTPKFESVKSFVGKTVVLIRGYNYGKLTDAFKTIKHPETGDLLIKTVLADRHEQALALIKAGRGDYLVDYEVPVLEALKKKPVESIQSVLLKEIILTYFLTLNTPDIDNVHAALVKGWKKYLRETGNLDKLKKIPWDKIKAAAAQ